MSRVSSAVAAFAITVSLAAGAAAQTPAAPAPPPPMTNLQVYPKDIPRPQLIATMQGFVQALGVQASGGCGYCHVGTAPQFDFAPDTNPKKIVARKMIQMSRDITAKLRDLPEMRIHYPSEERRGSVKRCWVRIPTARGLHAFPSYWRT